MEEAKEEDQIQMIKAKRIIVDSIGDHLIPIVSSKETPKEMCDALFILYGGMVQEEVFTTRDIMLML